MFVFFYQKKTFRNAAEERFRRINKLIMWVTVMCYYAFCSRSRLDLQSASSFIYLYRLVLWMTPATWTSKFCSLIQSSFKLMRYDWKGMLILFCCTAFFAHGRARAQTDITDRWRHSLAEDTILIFCSIKLVFVEAVCSSTMWRYAPRDGRSQECQSFSIFSTRQSSSLSTWFHSIELGDANRIIYNPINTKLILHMSS